MYCVTEPLHDCIESGIDYFVDVEDESYTDKRLEKERELDMIM